MTMIVGNAVAGSGAAGYQIQRSLRFNSADGTSLDRTPSSSTNRQTFTISFWAKNPSTAGSITTYYAAGSDTNNNETVIGYWDGLYVQSVLSGASWRIRTAAVYRDPSAWYHFVFAFDLGNGTQANRLKIYVNGVESTYSAADGQSLPSTANSMINSNVVQYIGRRHYSSTGQTTNAYMADFYLIDGQALTPSDFGETDSATGVWKPKAYTGTYGTNGFYLNFSDNSNTTAATLGKDSSGNGNNWTPNNFSVTAGAGNDSLVDTPTSYGTDTGVGGEVRGNYATLNPLGAGSLPLSNGNLDGANGSGSWRTAVSTIGVSSGKWYCEMVPTSGSATQGIMFGITQLQNPTSYIGSSAVGYAYYGNDGKKYNNAASATYGATVADNDIVGMALDLDAGTLVFYKNNVSQGTAYSGLSGTFYLGLSCNGTATATINFGQRPFAYTAPSGFKALCTQNLPTPTIGATSTTQANKYFDATLWTGNGTTQSITNSGGMQPDFLWVKSRSGTTANWLVNAVTGAGNGLISNSTAAEQSLGIVTSLDSSGFSVSTIGGTNLTTNGNAATFVGWNWKANGAGGSNTAGSITSTVSANTTSGFSIVTYTGTGANATVGHGLGVAPSMIICKGRSTTDNWIVYHASLGNQYAIYLNLTNAQAGPGSLFWNSTTPTSSVFSLGGSSAANTNGATQVAYCFAAVAGYSAFGSYTGNGSTDGPFVYTGFRPRYVMVKRIDVANSWVINDAARNTYNVIGEYLSADQNYAGSDYSVIDFTSNGFKLRNTSNAWNANGGTYIYAAFAEFPFKFANAR